MLLTFSIITLLFFIILMIVSTVNNQDGNLGFSVVFGCISLIIIILLFSCVPVKTEKIILNEDEYIYEIDNRSYRTTAEIEYKNNIYKTTDGEEYLKGDCNVYLIREKTIFGNYNETSEGDVKYRLYVRPKEIKEN